MTYNIFPVSGPFKLFDFTPLALTISTNGRSVFQLGLKKDITYVSSINHPGDHTVPFDI